MFSGFNYFAIEIQGRCAVAISSFTDDLYVPMECPGWAAALLHQQRRRQDGPRGRGVRRADQGRRLRLPLPRRPRKAERQRSGKTSFPFIAPTTESRLPIMPPPGQVHDIEDLKKACGRSKACPYFTAKDLAASADLIFCPYRCVGG